MTTTGLPEKPEDGPRRRRRPGPRDSHESVVGRLEQLSDVPVDRSDPAIRGLTDHATTGSGPTRQSYARDAELLQVSRRGMCRVIALTNCCSFLSEAGCVKQYGVYGLNAYR